MGRGIALVSALLLGCGGRPIFVCSSDGQCGPDGTCQDSGFCSFPDGRCPSGERYGAYSPLLLAGECVVATPDEEIGSTGLPAAETGAAGRADVPRPGTSTSPIEDELDASTSTGYDEGAADGTSDGDVLPDGLLGWWRLDDDPADGVRDETDLGHHGSCVECPEAVPGVLDGAYAFMGDQHVSIPHHATLEADTFTVAAWIRPSGAGPAARFAAVSKPVGSENANTFELYIVDTQPESAVFGCGNADADITVFVPHHAPGVWTHLAGSYDGETCRIYVNGNPAGEVPGPVAGVSMDAQPLLIGADIDYGTVVDAFEGELDDVQLYGEVLTDEQISMLAHPRP